MLEANGLLLVLNQSPSGRIVGLLCGAWFYFVRDPIDDLTRQEFVTDLLPPEIFFDPHVCGYIYILIETRI